MSEEGKAPEAKPKAGRKRTPTRHVVLKVSGDKNYELAADKLKDRDAAEKWIGGQKDEEVAYQPATFNGPPLKPKATVIRRPGVVPAG